MPKKDPKSITTISQSDDLDEYKYKSYEELSREFQEVYPAVARAFVLIPQMYNRLTLVDGLTHKDALVKIHNDHDHLSGFTERNIRRYLPANNPNIPRRVRTPRPKNSIIEISKEIFFSNTKSDDDRNRQSIKNFVVDDTSTDKRSETPYGVTSKTQEDLDCQELSEDQKLDAQKKTTTLSTTDRILIAPSSSHSSNKLNKTDLEADNILNFEVSLSYRDIQRYIAALRKKGKNEVWFSVTINAGTGKMIFKIGRNSEL